MSEKTGVKHLNTTKNCLINNKHIKMNNYYLITLDILQTIMTQGSTTTQASILWSNSTESKLAMPPMTMQLC